MKVTIYTERYFAADKYPFHDEGDYYTRFYLKIKSSQYFLECLASVSEQDKKKLVADHLKIQVKDVILMSKMHHYKLTHPKK